MDRSEVGKDGPGGWAWPGVRPNCYVEAVDTGRVQTATLHGWALSGCRSDTQCPTPHEGPTCAEMHQVHDARKAMAIQAHEPERLDEPPALKLNKFHCGLPAFAMRTAVTRPDFEAAAS